MSWKKHFTVYQGTTDNSSRQPASSASQNKFASWLPEIYAGAPNRHERYLQYDQMDQDSEINAALDIIAEFCTQTEDGGLPFKINYNETPSESEVAILEKTLQQWINLNDMDTRAWRLFRSILKYGDQFLIRDPKTWKLFWVNPANVDKIIVNEATGKEIELYFIKNLEFNFETLVASNINIDNYYRGAYQGPNTLRNAVGSVAPNPGAVGTNDAKPIPSHHILQLSLTEGLDGTWPFGFSILESVFKTFKQKEMLEDSILIYRVQRAPERRVFYIDVGDMPRPRAMAFLEQVKNEIQQKRIPNKSGGGNAITDSTYNPMSMMEDYFFAQTAEGRGSRVETLPGGENLGQIDDLRYFQNKMLRGLRVPSSYLPSGPEEGTATYNDGRVGTAFIQEFRFTQYCKRLQQLVAPVLDKEFKMFLKNRGVTIESNFFNISFNEPMNFSRYRQMELDANALNTFANAANIPYISKRFALERFLGLTEDEIIKNEEMLAEEQGKSEAATADVGLSDVNISAGAPPAMGGADLGGGAEAAPAPDVSVDGASPIAGDEGGGGDLGA